MVVTHPADGDLDGDSFGGADFQLLAANVIDESTGDTILPSHVVRDYEGVRVAFIGMTLEGTPGIVARDAVSGLTFLDEADTVNSLAPQLREEGIEAIVVLIHEGGFSDGGLERLRNGPRGTDRRDSRATRRRGRPGHRRPHQRRVRL